jgi:Flp pilus assembly protein TadD
MLRVVVYCLLVLTCYWPGRHAPFYFDDIHTIAQNAALQDPTQFLRHWVDPSLSSCLPYNRAYRPVTFSTYHLLYSWFHGSTLVFHLFKMALLVLLCTLTDQIWSMLAKRFQIPKSDRFSFLLGCLWAVHPALSESTLYITATSSVLAAAFYFAGILIFLKRPQSWFIQSLCFGLASLSKEEAITFPAILLLMTLALNEMKERRKNLLFQFIFATGLFVWIQSMIPSEQSVSRGSVSSYHYLLTQVRAWWWYQQIWWWPEGLNADNLQFGFTTSIKDKRLLIPTLVQLMIATIALRWRQRFPELLFGLLFYYISISPASSVIPLAEPVNERRMIIAYLGWTGASVAMSWRVLSQFKPSITNIASVLALTTFGLITHARAKTWAAPELLWQDTLNKNPDSPRAYNNLATVWIEQGQFSQALKVTTNCSLRFPYVYCWLNRAISHQHLGEYSSALSAFEQALALDPNLPTTHYYYGVFLHQIGLQELGIQELKKTLALTQNTHSPSIKKLTEWGTQ